MSLGEVFEVRLNLSLYNLPSDIYDSIAAFLGDPELFEFLTLSPHITISPYLLRDRQRAYWKRCSAENLAVKGNLPSLQYLHSLETIAWTTDAMDYAAKNGHLAVVEFLHSKAAPYTTKAMNWAVQYGHLAVVQFLHSVGAPYATNAMDWAAYYGHLAVVEFLHGIGAPNTANAMDYAARNGHLAVVEFLHGIEAPYTKYIIDWAASYGHLAVVGFLKEKCFKSVTHINTTVL